MVIPKKEKAGAMDLVTASTGGDIYVSACGCSRTQIKIDGGDLELLHFFLRESHRRSPISDFHDAATIDGDPGSTSVQAHWGS